MDLLLLVVALLAGTWWIQVFQSPQTDGYAYITIQCLNLRSPRVLSILANSLQSLDLSSLCVLCACVCVCVCVCVCFFFSFRVSILLLLPACFSSSVDTKVRVPIEGTSRNTTLLHIMVQMVQQSEDEEERAVLDFVDEMENIRSAPAAIDSFESTLTFLTKAMSQLQTEADRCKEDEYADMKAYLLGKLELVNDVKQAADDALATIHDVGCVAKGLWVGGCVCVLVLI
jgi:hypothetical protein